MKKVLMISDNKINGIGGGSLVEKRNYLAILNAFKGQYIDLKVISPDEELEHLQKTFKVSKNNKMDLLARFKGHSTFLYMLFEDIKHYIDSFKPDILFLGRSRLGFIAKYVKQKYPTTRIISCMENIEYDYVKGYFADKNIISRIPLVLLEKCCVKRDEKQAIKYADYLLYLSKRDITRSTQLYKKHVNGKPKFICPICIENDIELSLQSEKKTVVFIGSLNYSSNSTAVIRFLSDVWKPYFSQRNDVEFLVGGRNPNNRLVELINKFSNCRLIQNFSSLEAIIPEKSVVIAPIKKGAGMKTKIAECLSMGLPAIGTSEAFVGYDDALKEDKLKSLHVCNSFGEMVESLEMLFSYDDSRMKMIKKQNQELFRKCYSFDKAFTVFKDLFNGISDESNR